MKILHYTLGPPPRRSGGLTRYAVDLLEEQSKNRDIIHLYPGNVDFLNKKTRIIQKKSNENNKVENFELINSLPLPVFRGIKSPDDFRVSVSKSIYLNFLSGIKPDLIHVHTLMGLHKEFFESANELKIKLVYSTHDYFGICPSINLYKDQNKENCVTFNKGKGCIECCQNSMSTNSLLITQTSIYPIMKKVKILKKKFKNNKFKTKSEINYNSAKKYVELRKFYFEIFKRIDFFHFNSKLSESIFKKYLPGIKGEVVNITHSGILKKSQSLIPPKNNKSNKIRLGYLGPLNEHKGYYSLLDAFKQLPENKYELHLHGDSSSSLDIPSEVYIHGTYEINELESIFSNIDVLIIPSKWKETFGFITIEALSFGTPVIVSENVGSKDLVNDKYGWKYNPESNYELIDLLKKMDRKMILEKQMNIHQNFNVLTSEEHCENLDRFIYS